MKRVYVFCEGITEETFIKKILAKDFYAKNIILIPTSCKGVSKYSIIRKRLSDLCRNDRKAYVTTMLDYYGLPEDTPGKRGNHGSDIYNHIQKIEEAIKEDIKEDNLIPNLMLHEFEALLFSDPIHFEYCMPPRRVRELKNISDGFESPERINNGPDTAPSKRILKIYPQYSKVLDGCNIAEGIGLATMRQKCRHFDEWLHKIEEI